MIGSFLLPRSVYVCMKTYVHAGWASTYAGSCRYMDEVSIFISGCFVARLYVIYT